MKISYRSQPILKLLKDKSLNNAGYLQGDAPRLEKLQGYIYGAFAECNEEYRSRVRILSHSFIEAWNKAYDAILRSPELISSISNCCGTCILNDISVCYDITDKPDGKKWLNMHVFGKGNIMVGVLNADLNPNVTSKDASYVEYCKCWFSNAFAYPDEITGAYAQIEWLFCLLNFLKYCEIETKNLPAHSKTKDFYCKYVNDTEFNIQHINSTWFTNLVKSDGFRVRGHFRLQACGKDHKERKLTWIQDFEKTGYTAPARKLKEYA